MEGNSVPGWVVGEVGKGRKPGTRTNGDQALCPGSYQNHWGVLKAPMPCLSKDRK